MPYAVTLIDKAIHSCGSAAELARKMGIDRAEISKLHKGTRPLSPELAAELADIAGEDAREAAIAAIIERNADGRKGHLLKEILGKVLAAGEGGVLDSSYSGALISGSKTSHPVNQPVKLRIHRI
ncbi:helix-turn-helix domain-containing protein [Acidovorax sp. CF316]|uniref:helix-turn-helix domain-containing protein n=1 Tax=Acidovorax sp. CF316 TaxID=1144317 RepID=UPI0011B2505F|nr:helix-turn-helix domain-containing protein [Acidovorax sp. CF316]